jgi:hypothetical protein
LTISPVEIGLASLGWIRSSPGGLCVRSGPVPSVNNGVSNRWSIR